MSATTPGASASISPSSTMPMPSPSHSACEPSAAAASSLPAPWSRATCAVVPYMRKLKIANAVDITVAAMASEASWVVPRCPTIAVSTSTYSGSEASARSAGRASLKISASWRERTGLHVRRPQPRHRPQHSLVTGAAAQVARERLSRLGFRTIRAGSEEGLERHEDARGAEAALQRVLLMERLLKRVQILVGEALDRADARPAGLDGKRQAGADRLAVELDRARAAGALLAADLGPGQPALADEVGERGPRLDVAGVRHAVDQQRDPHVASIASRASAATSARRCGCAISAAASSAAACASPSRSAASALVARSGCEPVPSSAIAAYPGARTTATPAVAKLPPVGAYSANAVRAWAGSGGSSIAVSSSPGSSAVSSGPVKKSSITRSPRALRTWKRASSAVSATGSSALGSACATEPPTVPRDRIAAWPACLTACWSSGQWRATSGDRSSAA